MLKSAHLKLSFLIFFTIILFISATVVSQDDSQQGEWTYDPATGIWSHPKEWSYEQAAKAWEENPFGDPGMAPDSVWYGLELIWESITEFDQDHTYERFAEIRAMLEKGNYDEAHYAAEQAAKSINYARELTAVPESSEKIIDFLYRHEVDVFSYEEYREILEKYVQEQSGAVDETFLKDRGLDLIKKAIVEEQAAIEEQKKDLETRIAEEQGITKIEAEVIIGEKEHEAGLTEQKEEVQEELLEAREELAKIKEEFKQVEAEGKRLPNGEAFTQLLLEAEIRLDQSQQEFAHGNFGKSFGRFVVAEHLLDNAEKFLDEKASKAELEELVEKKKREREEEHQEYVSEYEQYREMLLNKYPEKKEEFDREYERSQKVMELVEKGNEQLSLELKNLLEQGVPETEAVAAISQKWAEEYERVYGDPYVPPMFEQASAEEQEENKEKQGGTSFVDTAPSAAGSAAGTAAGRWTQDSVTGVWSHPEGWTYQQAATAWVENVLPFLEEGRPIGEPGGETVSVEKELTLSATGLKTKGGFVEEYSYTDPATGYAYEITGEGYTYTTPLGIEHHEQFPEGYVQPAGAFRTGVETHTYRTETPKGEVKTSFYATGYHVSKPDGTTETHSYPEGIYIISGGGRIEIEPTGFKSSSQENSINFNYNPVYNSFVSDDGKVYTPQSSFQQDVFHYIPTKKNYQYTDQQGQTWIYHPSANLWTTSSGTDFAPRGYVIAPIGHEQEGKYTTPLGETWVWSATSETWNNQEGDAFYPKNGMWMTKKGDMYIFDQSTGKFSDPQSKNVIAAPQSDTASGWTYDSSTNMWSYPKSWSYDEAAKAWEEGKYGEIATAPKTDTSSAWTYDTTTNTWSHPQGWSYDEAAKAWEEGKYGEIATAPKSDTASGWAYDSSTGMWSHPKEWSYEQAAKAWEEGGYAGSSSSGGSGGGSTSTSPAASGSNTAKSWAYDSSTGSWSPPAGASYEEAAKAWEEGGYATGGSVINDKTHHESQKVEESQDSEKFHSIVTWLKRYLGLEK